MVLPWVEQPLHLLSASGAVIPPFQQSSLASSKWYHVTILNQGKENLKKIRNSKKFQIFK